MRGEWHQSAHQPTVPNNSLRPAEAPPSGFSTKLLHYTSLSQVLDNRSKEISEDKQEFLPKMAVFWVVAPSSLVDWHYNPQDSHLRTHHRENLKSTREFLKLLTLLPKSWTVQKGNR
jgi:hypothetical protein